VIKSYLQWLQNSDFDPNCIGCKQGLSHGDLVRLGCYGKRFGLVVDILDVMHLACLRKELTNDGGGTVLQNANCPVCSMPIVKDLTKQSVLMAQLREALGKFEDWRLQLPQFTQGPSEPMPREGMVALEFGPRPTYMDQNYSSGRSASRKLLNSDEGRERLFEEEIGFVVRLMRNLGQVAVNCLTLRNVRFGITRRNWMAFAILLISGFALLRLIYAVVY